MKGMDLFGWDAPTIHHSRTEVVHTPADEAKSRPNQKHALQPHCSSHVSSDLASEDRSRLGAPRGATAAPWGTIFGRTERSSGAETRVPTERVLQHLARCTGIQQEMLRCGRPHRPTARIRSRYRFLPARTLARVEWTRDGRKEIGRRRERRRRPRHPTGCCENPLETSERIGTFPSSPEGKWGITRFPSNNRHTWRNVKKIIWPNSHDTLCS